MHQGSPWAPEGSIRFQGRSEGSPGLGDGRRRPPENEPKGAEDPLKWACGGCENACFTTAAA